MKHATIAVSVAFAINAIIVYTVIHALIAVIVLIVPTVKISICLSTMSD